MAVITALQLHRRRRERVNVYLDGAHAFSLSLTLAASLQTGQQLDATGIAQLQDADERARAIDQAARFLGRRPRSVAEVRRQLQQKGFAEGAVTAALEHMTEQGYLDDHAFARFWVEDRLRFRPMGQRALRYGLRQKGVDAEVIETALASLDSAEAARRAARNQLRRWRQLTHEELRHKLWAFLQRRGFEGDLCREVVAEILTDPAAGEPAFRACMHEE